MCVVHAFTLFCLCVREMSLHIYGIHDNRAMYLLVRLFVRSFSLKIELIDYELNDI